MIATYGVQFCHMYVDIVYIHKVDYRANCHTPENLKNLWLDFCKTCNGLKITWVINLFAIHYNELNHFLDEKLLTNSQL